MNSTAPATTPESDQLWEISGNPTPAEVAAVTAVLSMINSSRSADPHPVRDGQAGHGWVEHWRRTSAQPLLGPDAWRRGVR